MDDKINWPKFIGRLAALLLWYFVSILGMFYLIGIARLKFGVSTELAEMIGWGTFIVGFVFQGQIVVEGTAMRVM